MAAEEGGASGWGEQELRALTVEAVAAAHYDTAAEFKEELEKLHLAKQAPAVAGAAPGGGTRVYGGGGGGGGGWAAAGLLGCGRAPAVAVAL